eukprot:4562322-Pleurochrysis_carterae.AAC.1
MVRLMGSKPTRLLSADVKQWEYVQVRAAAARSAALRRVGAASGAGRAPRALLKECALLDGELTVAVSFPVALQNCRQDGVAIAPDGEPLDAREAHERTNARRVVVVELCVEFPRGNRAFVVFIFAAPLSGMLFTVNHP